MRNVRNTLRNTRVASEGYTLRKDAAGQSMTVSVSMGWDILSLIKL